jgi:hypothetical protein
MLSHALAALVALWWSLCYQKTFQIKSRERRRYLQKAVNLGLCYRGFAPDSKLRSIVGAGKAAFFCCAYDVVSDWRDFDEAAFLRFSEVLLRSVSTEASAIAKRLYMEERKGILRWDGLSRGVDALQFITLVIGSERHMRENADLHHLGIIMQIVDDVLDWEDDLRSGETNCLRNVGREAYLKQLLRFDVNGMKRFLPHATILGVVIDRAQKKARGLLGGTVEFPCVPQCPCYDIDEKQQGEMVDHMR